MEKAKHNPTLAPTSDKVSNVKVEAEKPEKGTLVKKKNAAAGGATGVKKNKTNVLSKNAGGRNGATYGIRVKFSKQEAPEAGATQANGRLIKPAMNRQSPDFSAGMASE